MKRLLFLGFISLFSLGARGDLKENLSLELSSPAPRSWERLGQVLQPYHIVFVGIEDAPFRMLRGFSDNISAIRNAFKLSRISVTNTHFFESYESNAERLSEAFLKLYSEGQKRPLVIIGNPQSGPDSLYAILRNPKLVEDGMVEKIVLLLPAFGSPLADVTQGGSANGELAKFLRRFFGNKLDRFQTRPTRRRFDDALGTLNQVQRSALNSRLYYVRGSAGFRRVVGTFLEFPYLLMRPFGKTDSISFSGEQKLDGIGTDLGLLNVSHWDLFASRPAVTSSSRFRGAFTRALLEELFAQEIAAQ